MMLQINLKDTFEDFIWIIKVLDSSTSEDQMECVKNCFYLWEKKTFISSKFCPRCQIIKSS
jgi:hypothetical protein